MIAIGNLTYSKSLVHFVLAEPLKSLVVNKNYKFNKM